MTSTAVAILFLCAAALAPASAIAASHAAKIIYAIGDVSATDASGSRRAVKRGDFIASGDTVVTGKGRAQLKLTDGSFIALNPQTEYAFEDYSYDAAAPSSSRSFFNLVRGGVRLVTGAIARSNRSGWRLRTSVATIGIRGSGGYFRYVQCTGGNCPDLPLGAVPSQSPGPLGAVPRQSPEQQRALRVNVDFVGFTATDPVTGEESDLGPGEYICNPPCQPVNGAGDQEDLTYYDPEEEQRDFESGEVPLDSAEGPIPAGPAPDGTHISVAFPFIDNGMFLNSLADGEETNGMTTNATFGSLDIFEWFTGFPCEACVFTRNGGTEEVDPAPDGSTFSNTYATEWGRVINAWTVTEPFGAIVQTVGHFTWIASAEPTPDSELPVGIQLIYDQDIGGTLAALTAGASTLTEVANVRTYVRIEVDYTNGGNIDNFLVEVAPPGLAHPDNPAPGTFPSGSHFKLQSFMPTTNKINDGFLFFNSGASSITVPAGSAPDLAAAGGGMCNSGCTFFGTTVFGPAGLAINGVAAGAVTGAFQGNTAQPSYPPFSVNGAFIVEGR